VRFRRSDPHTLAGAYALDALTRADRAAFERHLGACEDCRQEAASLRAAAARLGQAAAAPPPSWLRQQVLAKAAQTRQLPPQPGLRDSLAPAAAAPGVAAPGRPGLARRGLAWPAAPRLAVAVAGACLLIALGFGGLMLHTQHRLTQEQAHSAEIAAVLTAPDATMMTARAAAGGRATVVMSHADHAMVLTTAHLPALPSGKRYEVWLMGPGGARPAGMLPPAHRGMTAPVVVSGLATAHMVGVTMEPAGGARRPTAAPVLMLHLPS
jgi:anti-sigma-K factor RskA